VQNPLTMSGDAERAELAERAEAHPCGDDDEAALLAMFSVKKKNKKRAAAENGAFVSAQADAAAPQVDTAPAPAPAPAPPPAQTEVPRDASTRSEATVATAEPDASTGLDDSAGGAAGAGADADAELSRDAAGPPDLDAMDDSAIAAMFGGLKKKKKRAPAPAEAGGADALALAAETDADLSYDDMLSRLYAVQQRETGSVGGVRAKVRLRLPEVARLGTKRAVWTNASDTCASLRRDLDHVQAFFLNELGTSGSVDGTRRLVFMGRFSRANMELVLRKYIAEYVSCSMCRSLDTAIERDASTRLQFMRCGDCGAQRTVAPIKAGFHAVTHADRKKEKQRE
jgi:translation initiation factor 2 subunit 2